MNKIGKIFALSLIACVLGSCAPKNVTPTYMVVWKNWNGAILEIDEHVKRGSFPEYNGETPTRPDEYGRSYSFSGWTPDLAKVTENIAYTAKFTVNRYMVDFDLDGGTSYSYNGPKTVYSFSTNIFFFDVAKEGYTFRGWSFNGTKIIDEKENLLEEPVMQKEMTFKAVYSQTSKVTITTDNPEAATLSGDGEYPYNSFVTLTAAVNDGYEFLGWYQNNSRVSTSANYQFILRNKDVFFEAKFRLRKYNLTVVAIEHGRVLMDSDNIQSAVSIYENVKKEYKSTISLAAVTTNYNASFFLWYGSSVNNTTNTADILSRNPIFDFEMPACDYQIAAIWNVFSIRYELNGGVNNKNNPYHFSPNSGNIQLFNPTKPGYDFLRWDLETAEINGDKLTTVTIENITELDCSRYCVYATLTAVWKANTYSITYELNDGINSPNNPSTYTPDDNTITLSSPAKHGYNFIGWYTSETSLNPEYKVEKIQKGSYGNLTLYARWTPISYEITYNLDGGINNPDNRDFYNIELSFIFLSPTRTGYTFLGWFDENNNQITSIEAGTTGNLTLTAHWNEGDAYILTLDSDGGTVSESTINVQYDHAYSLPTPTKTGYVFLGWYDGQTKVNESGTWKDTVNKTFTAHWSIIIYQITYDLDNGTNDPTNPTTYTVEDNITFVSPTRTGYTFEGWFNEDESEVSNIERGTTGNLNLSAHWNDGNTYSITLIADGTSNPEVHLHATYDHSYSLPTPTRDGYEFDGWYDGSTKIEPNGVWKYTSDKTFAAHWSIITYQISYDANGGTNDSSSPTTYTVEDNILFISPTRNGYTFLGWYKGDILLSEIESGTTGDIQIKAEWVANQNDLPVVSEDISKGTVAIVSGSGYTDEIITVEASPIGDCVFMGWYHDGDKVSNDLIYSFIMPASDYSLVAHFLSKEEWNISHGVIPAISEDEKTITYGLYPQTNVSDLLLISDLNALVTPESNGWYLFGGEYYAKVNATSDNPDYKFDNGITIESGTTYWFKCEPIIWNVLSKDNGDYYILSNVLLDANCYHYSTSSRTINGKTIYSNNYEYSNIRTWLNSDFYNSAFALGNNNIQTTTIDNSAATTESNNNPYACNDTQDKVFLPSYSDYINSNYGFSTSTISTDTRSCKTTDWARARGARCNTYLSHLYHGYYWTRSPRPKFSGDVVIVDTVGAVEVGGTISKFYSVRPAIIINIA